jgi:hypothetical protein
VGPSPPERGSDDDRAEICSMLGVVSTTSSSSSSSSDSSAAESVRAPQPNLNIAISSIVVVAGSELPVIPEMSELDVAQSKMEGMVPNALCGAGGSASMFLYKLKLHFFVVSPANLAFLWCR